MSNSYRFLLAGAILSSLFLLPSVTRSADEPAPNSLTAKEKADGWKLLFDGKTTKGWHKYKGKEIGDRWKVVDGTLALKHKDGKEGGDIATDEMFISFELSIEWKVTPGANSGIMYRVAESEDSPGFTGPEYQILDNAKHPDGRKKETSAASCYGLYAPSEDVTKPVGEWNQARIVVNGNHVEHWLNGKKVVEYEFDSDDWNKRVAASKFKEFKNFGKIKKGEIDLQDHGDDVSYRNIKIRVLDGKCGEEDARAVIDKAIKANGGVDHLTKYRATRTKAKGKVELGGGTEFTYEGAYLQPDKLKETLELEVMGNKAKIVIVCDGEKGWIVTNGELKDMDEKDLDSNKETTYFMQLLRMAALKDKSLQFLSLADIEVNGSPAAGVKVLAKGHKDLNLYFDRETGLLAKVERQTLDPTSGGLTTEERIITGYQNVDGSKFAKKIIIKHNGKKFCELEIVEHKLLEKLDASEFSKP